MYTTERYEAEISVKEYLDQYVDMQGFLEKCRECSNYEHIWSCPPFNFDIESYWRQHERLELTAIKIIFDEEYAGKSFPKEELSHIIESSIGAVKEDLSRELLKKEKEKPGSISLSAGSCILCSGICSRKDGAPCRCPDEMRYSIEALGGNVGLTISRLMGIELEWMEEGKLPTHFVLV